MTDFFEGKKAAAIFKHAVLNSYIDPLAMKIGLMAKDHRVAFIDGYAGEGRYEDGSEGSPALVIRKAKALAAKRRLECYFVEQDTERLASLRAMVEAEGEGVLVEIFEGDVADHLDDLLARTDSGYPPILVYGSVRLDDPI